MATKYAVAILIGNSDDKLSQKEWSSFVREVNYAIRAGAKQIHFNGYSDNAAPFQNACWVCEPDHLSDLVGKLQEIRKAFRQDSIAIINGPVRFI